MTGVANPGDPATVFWNPAGIAGRGVMSVDMTAAVRDAGSPGNWSFLMLNSAPGADGNYGLGLIRSFSKLNDTQNYRSFTFIFPLSYNIKAGVLPLGVSAKFISESIDGGKWHYGLKIDVGALFLSKSGIGIGFSSLNYSGSNLKSYENSSWFGISWQSKNQPLSLNVQTRADRPFDLTYMRDNYGFGVEFKPGQQGIFSQFEDYHYGFRGGIRNVEKEAWVTFGITTYRSKNGDHFSYSLVVESKEWKERVHFLTYGYSLKINRSPSRGGSFR